MKFQSLTKKTQSWIGVGGLVLFALIYCLSALIAPFWNDNDTWSNLLPIIHYRHSILDQHTLPLFTELWYGGRDQWANPLWSFLYVPSTVVWLVTPLDWGTRIVLVSHLIFSLLAGRKLAGLFLGTEIEKASAAVILSSPVFPALTAGHMEKVMSWGWVLLALSFLFNEKLTSTQRGLWGGICLGIIPLTGANYYTFYAGILLLPLVFSDKDRKLLLFFFLGSLLGLLHLPSVWQMMGHARAHAQVYVEAYSVNFPGIISALATGFSKPLSWETWTPVGILTIYLFGLVFARKVGMAFSKNKNAISPRESALLISIFLLFLFASGIAYLGHDLLDLFRVPARALAFLALAVALFVLVNAKGLVAAGAVKQSSLRLFLFISAVQIAASAWVIRPAGSDHSPYETSVLQLADTLKADHARSVWISTRDLSRMYIHVGLTQKNFELPNVYYGDLGQSIEITGNHCGYSFDHLIVFAPITETMYEINSDTEWSNEKGEIPLSSLFLLEQIELDDDVINVYRVVCDE